MRKMYTNGTAFNMLMALDSASNEVGQLGFAIAKNRRKIKTELEEYIERRNDIIIKYTTRDDEGKPLITDTNAALANQELEPYSNMECALDIAQVTEDVFCGGALTAQQMFELDFMVKEENENEVS